MVSTLSIGFMIFSGLLIFLFPLGLAVYMYKKERISLRAIITGGVVFVLVQLLTRLPLLNALATQPWFQGLMENLLFSAVVVGGLSAGLFEEIGRYLGFRFFLNNELSWENGIAYGIGHGGIEAILLMGTTYINNAVLSLMINNGTFDRVIAPELDSELAAAIKTQLIETSPFLFLVGGLDRVFAITIQIALSLVVLYAVVKRKFSFVIYAILLHALVNSIPVILMQQGFNVWAAEIYLFILAAIALFFIIRSRKLFTLAPVPEGEGED
ncbi:MAG: YhfC family intramembrane metalloprotease [Firmicutes bacterium]|nr:YhfC family intramembrane metalloprotease [Bacillota bacterium]